MGADRRWTYRVASINPVCEGPAADLRLRLCQALARRGAELGKFAAHHRLVYVLAHHPRFPVLWRDLVHPAAPALARPPDCGNADRRAAGSSSKTPTGSSSDIAPARCRWTILATASSIRYPIRCSWSVSYTHLT